MLNHNVFLYYFDGQLDGFLSRYEYTVQMTGPHGLTVDLRSTDPALGACVLVSALAIWGFLRSKALDKMALDTKIEGHVELANNKLRKSKEENDQ